MTAPGPTPILTTRPNGQIDIDWPQGHNPQRIYSVTGGWLEGAVAEHNRIHAGAEHTPIEPGTFPTPGQLWTGLLAADPDKRHEWLTTLIRGTEITLTCFDQDHAGQIAHLQQALSALAHGPTEANTPEAERWYVSCGCDTHGDHLGCRPQCIAMLGCRHVIGVDYSAPTEAEADDHVHSMRCAVRQGPLGATGITEHHTEDTR